MRIRDIIHDNGLTVRVQLSGDQDGMLVQLSDPLFAPEPVSLDPYGCELLAAFLLNARLAAGSTLAEEWSAGLFGCRFRLLRGEAVELRQADRYLLVRDLFWDRLFAELTMAAAHARYLSDPGRPMPRRLPTTGARILH